MTRRVSLVLVLFAVLTMLAAIPSEAQSTDPSVSSVYRLQPTSTYQHGCFAPCMCPVMETGGVRGTFRLTRTGSDGSFLYFAVTDVNWLVPTGTGLRISGSGTYRTGSYGRQQMVLDLKVGDHPLEHYDSGLVSGSRFPSIDIEISVHGRYCLDTVFGIHARPLMMLGLTGTALSWQPMPEATSYDVVQGDVQILRQTGGDFAAATSACLASHTTGTSVSYGAAPPSGRIFWFLARDVDGPVVETYDDGDAAQVGSRDSGVNSSPASCP